MDVHRPRRRVWWPWWQHHWHASHVCGSACIASLANAAAAMSVAIADWHANWNFEMDHHCSGWTEDGTRTGPLQHHLLAPDACVCVFSSFADAGDGSSVMMRPVRASQRGGKRKRRRRGVRDEPAYAAPQQRRRFLSEQLPLTRLASSWESRSRRVFLGGSSFELSSRASSRRSVLEEGGRPQRASRLDE